MKHSKHDKHARFRQFNDARRLSIALVLFTQYPFYIDEEYIEQKSNGAKSSWTDTKSVSILKLNRATRYDVCPEQ